MLTYSETAAFWVFNNVTNFAYLRYSDMIKDVQKVQSAIENRFVSFVPLVDKAAADVLKRKGDAEARKFLTEFSVNEANNMTAQWKKLGQYLLVKYIDGNIKKEKDGKFERTETGLPPMPLQPGYPEWWYRAIAKSTGEQFKVSGSGH
jgi:dipeptidase